MATWSVKVSDEAGTARHEVRVDAADAAEACDLAALDLRGSGVGGPVPRPPDGSRPFSLEREAQMTGDGPPPPRSRGEPGR